MFCCVPTGVYLENSRLVRTLQLLALLQASLGVFTFIVDPYSGLELGFGAIVLVFAMWSKNWCCCIFYILLSLQDVVTSLQTYSSFFSELPSDRTFYDYFFILTLLKYPFYLISIFYTFLAYKELKALFIEKISKP